MSYSGRTGGLTRREVLRRGAAATLVASGALPASRVFGQTPAVSPVPGIVKPLPPELFFPRGTNAEMRWTAMRGAGYLTPIDRFFVRNHTATPAIDPASWRLRLFGAGLEGSPTRDAPVALNLYDLRRLPWATVTAAVECAGNGRTGFAQQGQAAAGTAWNLGAVGVARWRGPRLRDVLKRAGLRDNAVHLMPEGLDATVKDTAGADQGHVRRPLPINKALYDTIIAMEMNGEPLPADHGWPARLIVPGWIGVANIKWLGYIEVADRPLFSYWNTAQYRFSGGAYPADSPPLSAQNLKSAFEVDPGATFALGQAVTLTGRSWSGGKANPKTIEVSTDGGQTWRAATPRGAYTHHGWLRWSADWTPSVAGPVDLIARATDNHGLVQPATVPFNTNGYLYDGYWRNTVTVA